MLFFACFYVLCYVRLLKKKHRQLLATVCMALGLFFLILPAVDLLFIFFRAKNMRKKLQKLKRRNTDSLLSAALMTVRGSNRITQADAAEWGTSFESLLTDKSKDIYVLCTLYTFIACCTKCQLDKKHVIFLDNWLVIYQNDVRSI